MWRLTFSTSRLGSGVCEDGDRYRRLDVSAAAAWPPAAADDLSALCAILGDELGARPLRAREAGTPACRLALVVNLRASGALLGTLGATAAPDGSVELGDVRAELEGARRSVGGEARASAAAALAAEGGALGGLFGAVTAALDVLSAEAARLEAAAAAARAARPDKRGVDVAPRVLLLHIDHMRRRGPYVAAISSWAAELGLRGFLLLPPADVSRGLILVLLTGGSGACREYLRRARTMTVDVDASGRACREKQMQVLHDDASPLAAGETDIGKGFVVMEGLTRAEALRHVVATGAVPAAVLADLGRRD